MPDSVDVLLNLILNARGTSELLKADKAAKDFFDKVERGAVVLDKADGKAAEAAVKFSQLADKFNQGKLAAGEFEAKSAGLQQRIGKLGPALHTSIYQLSALYYLLGNVATQLKNATEQTLEYALSVETLSAQTGISSQTASAYTLASKQLGISVDTTQEAFRTFSDRLGRATGLFGEPTKGSKDMARAMKALGIDVFDASGQVRSLESLMPEIFSAFQKLGPGIKSTAIATALFGQRADEMIPLLIRGSDNIDNMRARAEELGLALTPERTENIRNLAIAFNDVGLAGQSMIQTILEGLGPLGSAFSDVATSIAKGWRETFVNIQADIISFRAILEAMAAGKSAQEAFGIGDKASSAFAKAQGFIPSGTAAPGSNRPRFIVDPTVQVQNGTPQGIPGEDVSAEGDKIAKATQDVNDKLRKLRDDYIADSLKAGRDFINKRNKEEEDYQRNRAQSIEDFYRKQAQKGVDFDLQTFEQSRDFDRKQLREFEDYQIDRARLIEDFGLKQAQDAESDAQKRIDLEEKTRKKLQDVNDKWDEILLRLRIGGDVDSIRLAEQKRLEALNKAREEETGPGSDLAKFEEDARRRQEIERADLEIRLKRLDEDYALRDERRKADFATDQEDRRAKFEADQAEAIAEFSLELTRRDEEHRIKRDRDSIAFGLAQADRFAEYDKKRNEIIDEFKFEIGVLVDWQPILERIHMDSQNSITDNMRENVNTRIGLAIYEKEQLSHIYDDTNDDSGGGRKKAFGGIVPGSLGSPQPILAHGGERITPPATSSYYSNVRQGDQVNINAPVTFSNNVNSDAIAHRLSQRASRELGRTIAARRAFGG